MIRTNGSDNDLYESSSIRWTGSFLFVIGIHISAVLYVMFWKTAIPNARAEPMAAIMIELAPLPVAPEIPTDAIDPAPVQEEVPPPPPEPVLEPEPEIEPEELIPEPEPEDIVEPLPEIPEIKEAKVVLPPKPKPKPITKIEPPEEQLPEQKESAPPSVDAPPAPQLAAPKEGAVSLANSQAPATWYSVLLSHMERYKHYPRKARRKKQETVVFVRVKINRDGTVISSRIETPGKYEILNEETLAMIIRAEPLPLPPPEITGETIEFVVPVEFLLEH